MPRVVRLRKSQVGRGRRQTLYSLTVPVDLARVIPEGQEFAVSLDEQGLHYRPLLEAVEPPKRPSWGRR
jgi:hypothetical protein